MSYLHGFWKVHEQFYSDLASKGLHNLFMLMIQLLNEAEFHAFYRNRSSRIDDILILSSFVFHSFQLERKPIFQ